MKNISRLIRSTNGKWVTHLINIPAYENTSSWRQFWTHRCSRYFRPHSRWSRLRKRNANSKTCRASKAHRLRVGSPDVFCLQEQGTGATRRTCTGWAAAAAAAADEIWGHPAPGRKESPTATWALDILAEIPKTFTSTHCTLILPVDEEIHIERHYVLS